MSHRVKNKHVIIHRKTGADMNSVKRRALTVSFITALVIISAAFGYTARIERQKRIVAQEVAFERALLQMTQSTSGIRSALDTIGPQTGKDEIAKKSYEIKYYCNMAVGRMCDMPVDTVYTMGLCRFFNVAADYSESMLREYDGDGLLVLKSYAKKIDTLLNYIAKSDDKTSTLHSLKSDLSEYPNLYYNGKYSNGNASRGFSMLYKAEKISEGEALEKAKKLLGKHTNLTLVKSSGFPPVYTYVCNNASVEITVMGGYPIRLLFDLSEKDARYEESECIAAAAKFIENLRIKDMELAKVRYSDGAYFADFAHVYTDGSRNIRSDTETITVGVAADTLRICYYDAYNYYRYRSNETTVIK